MTAVSRGSGATSSVLPLASWPRARGLTLTTFGLGAAQLGNLGHVVDDESAGATFQTAWDGGVRYVDTAPHYGLGLSERRLGRLLAGVPRDDVVVSTKVGRLLEPSPESAHLQDDDGFAVPASHRRKWDFSRDGVRRSVEQSLERLGLDHLDIAYLHDPDEHWDAASTTGIDALCELRDEGVVRAVGAGMNQSSMLADFVRTCDVDVVLLAGRFSLLDQAALDDLLPAAGASGVGVVVGGVYNSGILARDTVDPDTSYDYQRARPDVVDRARRIAARCAEHGVTLPEAAVAFPLLHPAVVSVVVGSAGGPRTAQNLSRFAVTVPDTLWTDLESDGLVRLPPRPVATSPAPPVQRLASVIGIAPEHVEEYERLHATGWPAVLERLSLSNVQNYSIYRHEGLLFSYMEYVGADLDADMAAIAADPTTQQWWRMCDPLQRPLHGGRREDGGQWWTPIDEIFHLD